MVSFFSLIDWVHSRGVNYSSNAIISTSDGSWRSESSSTQNFSKKSWAFPRQISIFVYLKFIDLSTKKKTQIKRIYFNTSNHMFMKNEHEDYKKLILNLC